MLHVGTVRPRALAATPLLSAFAFIVAGGVSLEATLRATPRSFDQALVGEHEIAGLRVFLDAGGVARVGHHEIPAIWHSNAERVRVEWVGGSASATLSWVQQR